MLGNGYYKEWKKINRKDKKQGKKDRQMDRYTTTANVLMSGSACLLTFTLSYCNSLLHKKSWKKKMLYLLNYFFYCNNKWSWLHKLHFYHTVMSHCTYKAVYLHLKFLQSGGLNILQSWTSQTLTITSSCWELCNSIFSQQI